MDYSPAHSCYGGLPCLYSSRSAGTNCGSRHALYCGARFLLCQAWSADPSPAHLLAPAVLPQLQSSGLSFPHLSPLDLTLSARPLLCLLYLRPSCARSHCCCCCHVTTMAGRSTHASRVLCHERHWEWTSRGLGLPMKTLRRLRWHPYPHCENEHSVHSPQWCHFARLGVDNAWSPFGQTCLISTVVEP